MNGISGNLALAEAVSISGPDMRAAFCARYPDSAIEEITQQLTDLSIFRIEGYEVLVLVLPHRLPHRVYKQALKQATWEGAADALRGHQGHVIVSLMGDQPRDYKSAVTAAHAVARMLDALASILPASAVLLAASDRALPTQAFEDVVTSVEDPAEQAWLLWVNVGRFSRWPWSRPDVRTTGLRYFVGREIMFTSRALELQDLFDRVSSMAQYLLIRGPVIQDNETFGILPGEKIRVRYGSAGPKFSVPVYRLSLEDPEPVSGTVATPPLRPA